MNDIKKQYITKINSAFKMQAINYVEKLAETMLEVRKVKTIYLWKWKLRKCYSFSK